jgi:DNA polymerase-3 subunit alpha
MAEFVHLHVHSEYSLLDGLSSCRELATRAAELGMDALALTDHGAMFGALQFYKACRALGIKPIIGLEAYVAPGDRRSRDPQRDRHAYHIILLAQNWAGYQNLMHLATLAQLEGFYHKPRVDRQALAEHAEGLIVLSGCGSSEVSRLLLEGQTDEARRTIAWYREVFPGRYYLELQEHDIPELARVNAQVVELARELDVPLVATNDAHYARREQAAAHDVLLCIQTGKTVNEPKRVRMDGDSFYLKSPDELARAFAHLPEALTNTLRIAESCELELQLGSYHLPPFPVPDGFDAQSYLRHLCEQGLGRRYPTVAARERERLDYELDIIHRMGFDTYFLIVWDLCRFAKEQGIWWNVRGSGGSSIVAYALGITNLDPLEHGLIFERFLNLGRVTMPDIDLDFPDDQRAALIRYTVGRYGHDQVAQIITFGTMGAKAAIRDVGRALDYPLNEVDRIARLVPAGPKVTLESALEEVAELRQAYESEAHIRRLIDTARALEGNIRHASTHAAGVVVSDVPLVNYVPLHRPTRGGEGDEIGTVTQYTMEELEELGLLKIDFLGLSTLTIMRRACELVRERHGVSLDLNTIPVDDPAIYSLLSRGDVTGIFQVEGEGMRRVLVGMQPTEFEHITATISLFRPGPMEYISDYIARLHGEKSPEYRHPALEPILAETFGIIVYQEQIIRILTDIAGYTPSEADLVRRAVGKKKKEELLKHRESFVEGAVRHSGLPREVAEGIFDDIEYFARYGFNKSHAVDYAVLTCQTAYLKAKYPVEYMAALLSVERNNTQKVGQLVAECRHMGIPVLPPDVNRSGLDFTIEEGPDGAPAIRFGMAAVKNVGEGPVETILAARAGGGPFTGLEDFCQRVDLRQVNRRALESLIKVGALEPFGNRGQLLATLDRILNVSANLHRARDVGQMSLFDGAGGMGLSAVAALPLPTARGAEEPAFEVSQKDILAWEKELVGVYISEHPLQEALLRLRDVATATLGTLGEGPSGQQVVVLGMVQHARRHVTKKGEDMAFVTLEGLDTTCDVVVFPRLWQETRDLWQPDRVLVVSGKLDTRGREQPSILCDWAKPPEAITVPAGGDAAALSPGEPPPSPDWQQMPLAPRRPPGTGVPRGNNGGRNGASRPASPPGTVLVTWMRSGEQAQDVATLRAIHQALTEQPGDEEILIRVTGGGQGPIELAFPNHRTRFSPYLVERLNALAGAASIHIEHIAGGQAHGK